MSACPNLRCHKCKSESRVSRSRWLDDRVSHEGAVLLDEEDPLDRDCGVGVDDERRVLEMRDEERHDGEELFLRELWRLSGAYG